MLAPLPPPSGGIASWTVRFKDYCERESIPLSIVNIAMRGDRSTSEVMTRSFKDEFLRTKSIIRELRKKITTTKPDVVHLNSACSPLGIIRDALCAFIIGNRIPIVFHCRCNIEDQLGTKLVSRFAFKYLVRKAKSVIVLNQFSKDYVDKIQNGKAVYIPNFINQQMIEKHIIRDRIEKIVYVGHVEKAKGLDQILVAASLLPNISFLLVGAVREDISQKTIPQNVSIIGRVFPTEVKEYLHEADVFVFPSLTEGFSNAVLEAMAMGLPIIASNVGANADMIEDKGGIILNHNNGRDLFSAIIQLSEREKRIGMSLWNNEKVLSQYTIERVMKMYFSVYEQITNCSLSK